MSKDEMMGNRGALIHALLTMAETIEGNPPPIVGSDIFVHAAPGARAIGSSISVTAGPGAGSGVGQRVSVVAQSGQTVIGQRITVVVGGDPVQPPPSGASSQEDISHVVVQLREAANVLSSTDASRGWIEGLLDKVSKWGSPALSGAVSGASNALARFFLTGT